MQTLKIGHFVFINTEIKTELSGQKNVYVSISYTKTDYVLSFRYSGDAVYDSRFWFILGTQIENKKNQLRKEEPNKDLKSIDTIYVAIQNYFKSLTK